MMSEVTNMTECKTGPSIVIDFSNNLIRIHKKTIINLGSPKNILLIVNPEKMAICVAACPEGLKGSHKIILNEKHCYELYSKSIIDTIKAVFDCWQDNKSYRISGIYACNMRIAKFIVTDSVPITSYETVKYNV